MMLSLYSSLLSLLILFCSSPLACSKPALHPDEAAALKEIVATLGTKQLNLSRDPCQSMTLDITNGVVMQGLGAENIVICDCHFDGNTTCRITQLTLKTLVKLVYLESIDLCRNFLYGTIPMEWSSMPYLKIISLCANRLSGTVPKGFARFTNLTFLNLEANAFSGTIPDELGHMVNLEKLALGSNQFIGTLPATFVRLKNITDFRASDNNFTGTIPEFIGNWSKLQRLELQGSGFEGPIPSSIFGLPNMTVLRITDMLGPEYAFPNLSSKTIRYLVLRNLNLSGPIPPYVWELRGLIHIDVSFNKLEGEIPTMATLPRYTYLSSNMLTGSVESGSFITSSSNIDLSYNNFTWSPGCKRRTNINAYRSSILKKNLSGLLPCSGLTNCQRYQKSLHINCGGGDVNLMNPYGNILYEGDNETRTSGATNYQRGNWGYSSTGDFVEDQNKEVTYTVMSDSVLAVKNPELYMTARRSPLFLTYYALCMENGNYSVKLHFVEIQFSDDKRFGTLGRRMFNIYVQGELVREDFNIAKEANGTGKVVIKELNIKVIDHTLEIRLYWAGKGTTYIPARGNYGPLISAISVCPSSVSHCGETKSGKTSTKTIVGVTTAIVCLFLLIMAFCYWRRCNGKKNTRNRDLKGLDLQTGSFTLRQLRAATNDFDLENKIGEGGFGSVFTGELCDGTNIAVKQLSSKSRQGNREFINEIGLISGLHHPNLVKLYGCCVERNQLLLVYEYMENNCLARWLFDKSDLKLDWATRHKICVGVARGLAFLHEESAFRIVHRDIKATNVLLDSDFNAKISDFGLARLYEAENTHISTRVGGTIGYMAPEYALWGHLTEKADVYSFGVLALEIVSSKCNTSYRPENSCVCLLDWAFVLQKKGNIMEVVDPSLQSSFDKEEAGRMIRVALLCTNASPTLRPSMSEVVSMLDGQTSVQEVISDPSMYGDYRFTALKEHYHQVQDRNSSQCDGLFLSSSSYNW